MPINHQGEVPPPLEALRRKGQEPARWHWVYPGTIFRLDQRGHLVTRRPVITERGYVATRAGLESFERQLYAEALPALETLSRNGHCREFFPHSQEAEVDAR